LLVKFAALFCLSFIMLQPVHAEPLMIAVASNFARPIRHIAKLFETETGCSVVVTSGSSGKLYAQIMQGAPFHIFFSADTTKPHQLEKQGVAVSGSRFTYARGALVLWAPKMKPVSPSAETLAMGDFTSLALANSRLAPYGLAAKQVMEKLNVYEGLRKKLIYGENIAQTYQFVKSASVEMGFVALSQVSLSEESPQNYWIIPEELYQPIFQDAVVLKNVQYIRQADAFVTFFKQDRIQNVVEGFGYRSAQ